MTYRTEAEWGVGAGTAANLCWTKTRLEKKTAREIRSDSGAGKTDGEESSSCSRGTKMKSCFSLTCFLCPKSGETRRVHSLLAELLVKVLSGEEV